MPKSSTSIVLHAAEYFFGNAGTKVETILGSCVSITLWHPTKLIGGICHYALPGASKSFNERPNPRFAEDCFYLFEQSMAKHNSTIRDYQVKLFGGGNMIKKSVRPNVNPLENLPVGDKNVLSAFNWIHRQKGETLVAHVGEFGYRKIIFDTATGDVWVKFTPVEKTPGDHSSLTGKS